MAYDVELADRLREVLATEPDVTERKMFGGLAFLVAGHMTVAANSHGALMLRIDPAEAEMLLADPRASRIVMQGREMAGWLGVETGGTATDDELAQWVEHGVGFVRSLPPKAGTVTA